MIEKEKRACRDSLIENDGAEQEGVQRVEYLNRTDLYEYVVLQIARIGFFGSRRLLSRISSFKRSEGSLSKTVLGSF